MRFVGFAICLGMLAACGSGGAGDEPDVGTIVDTGVDTATAADTPVAPEDTEEGEDVVEPTPDVAPDVTVVDVAEPTGAQWHVSPTGSDSDDCGTEESPCQLLATALAKAQPGDQVLAHTGLYEEKKLVIPSGVWLVSADGPLAAKIYSGEKRAVYFHEVQSAGIDGFEIYGDWNAGPAGDGLVRIYNVEDITVRNCLVHDAPHDQDCIKVSGTVKGLLIENVIAWNPGMRNETNFQEVLDIFGSAEEVDGAPPIEDVVVRGCWFFHTAERRGDYLTYAKVNVRHILYENNIFGPSEAGGDGNANVCIGTPAGNPDPSKPANLQTVVRNNVFVGLKGDAPLGIRNASEAWIYNNVFYNNSGPDARAVIELRGNEYPLGPVHIFNNIFAGNQPTRKGGTFFWVRDAMPTVFMHDRNLYHDNVSNTEAPFDDEANGIYDQAPMLADPGIPSIDPLPTSLDVLETLRARFGISADSPAVNHGLDAISVDGHPDWSDDATRRWDIGGDPRPAEDSWDLGVEEKSP